MKGLPSNIEIYVKISTSNFDTINEYNKRFNIKLKGYF